MTATAIKLWLPLVALFAASPVLADTYNLAPPSREEVQQELYLVQMMITSSPLVARSGDDKVKQSLELARTLYTRGNDAFNAGNMVWADAFLDEALSVLEEAARLTSDPQQTETRQRDRYAEMLDDVRAFEATYQDVRSGQPAKDMKPYDTKIERTRDMIYRAQVMVRDGLYKEATELLGRVHEVYISVLNELLATTALVYDTKFKSPVEEFEYELARYRSFEELIPIARDQFKPDEFTLKLSERYVQDARTAHGVAEKQAAGGDHAAAISTLQDATKRLQTSLRTMGLEVPQ